MSIEQTLSVIQKNQEETLTLVKNFCNNGMTGNKDRVYDLKDLEDSLHVSRRTLFKWKSEGRMRFSQIGKKIFVTDAELQRFLKTNETV